MSYNSHHNDGIQHDAGSHNQDDSQHHDNSLKEHHHSASQKLQQSGQGDHKEPNETSSTSPFEDLVDNIKEDAIIENSVHSGGASKCVEEEPNIIKDENYYKQKEERKRIHLQNKEERRLYREKRDRLKSAHDFALNRYWILEKQFVEEMQARYNVEIGSDHEKLVEYLYLFKKDLVNHNYSVEVIIDERRIIFTKPKSQKVKKRTFKFGKSKSGATLGRVMELDRLIAYFEEMFAALGEEIKTFKEFKEFRRWLTRDFKSSNLRAAILMRMKKKAYSDEYIKMVEKKNAEVLAKRAENERIREERRQRKENKMNRRILVVE